MSTIYLVTSGSYSDYRTEGVFDDIALAEAFVRAFGTDNERRIEERTLNPNTPEIRAGLRPFSVRVARDGTVLECTRSTSVYGFCEPFVHSDGVRAHNASWYFYLFAADEHHAAKIANERRVQLIAMGAWA